MLHCVERAVSSGEGLTFFTDVRLLWTPGEGVGFRWQIAGARLHGHLPKLYGMHAVTAAQGGLEGGLVIESTDPEALRRLLTPAVRGQVEGLARSLGGAEVFLAMDPDGFLVAKVGRFGSTEALEAHLAACTDLWDALLAGLGLRRCVASGAEPAEAAIEFLPAGEEPDRVPVCQVCGQCVGADPVTCPRCGAPHHRDCWEYNGGCSIYGCASRREG